MTTPASPSRRWLIALVVAALAGAALAFWRGAPSAPSRALTLYYGDPQAMYLVPVAVQTALPAEPAAAARAIVERLAVAPDARLVPLVPAQASLSEASLQGADWRVKLAMGAGTGSTSERLMAGALVRSLVESHPGSKRVELRLVAPDGQPYLSQHLDLSEPVTPAEFTNQAGADAPGLRATLWWGAAGTDRLLPVEVSLSQGTGSPVRDALERLVAGPPSGAGAFLQPIAPVGLHPTWRALEGGVARVDLNRAVPEGPEGVRFVEAVVLTLTEHAGVKAVRFERDGLHMPAQVGPYALGEAIARPAAINALGSPERRE